MMTTVAAPCSRLAIRRFASQIRQRSGLDETVYFPVMPFLEQTLVKIDPQFTLEVCDMHEMGSCHGLTTPSEHKIKLREDIYDGACNGRGRDRFTVAHEIGHYFMHQPRSVSFARTGTGKTQVFCDPEWQADAFAGELLIPAHLMRGKRVEEIAQACGVSTAAARVQQKIINR
ncbi:MAG: ImmA/IrrE family metallo-endopeptidase [Oscillospiraceae bacterium]|nr:ImmA/IrrE family metallo-endopeptidase [Oscillospiraceae bacterium]